MRTRLACLIVAATAVYAGRASALAPDEVLVVANAASPESLALAKAYATARGVPDSNVAAIETTTAYDVSRKDYDAQIDLPLRQVLAERRLEEKVRCLCLMWGVPVRVAGPAAEKTAAQAVYRLAAEKAHHRMAMDYKLLGTIGRKFPPPQTDGLTPLGKLFESPMPEPTTPLPAVEKLKDDLFLLMANKQMEIDDIKDPAQRDIARRQILAIHLDLTGLKGLIRFLGVHPSTLAPAPEDLKRQLDEAARQLADLQEVKASDTEETVRKRLDLLERTDGLLGLHSYAFRHSQGAAVGPTDNAGAAVDSELAFLMWEDRSKKTAGPVTNPLHWRFQLVAARQKRPVKAPPLLMTARIDGPSHTDALRIIEDSIAVEKSGLKGTFYIDAGGPERLKEAGRQYDALFTTLYAMVRERTALKAVLDDKPSLFPPDSCPDAALYVGWYSLKTYVPAFTWQRGAVGWHVASFEAMHLRDEKSQEWCPKMIRGGVAATVGAVNEPFLTSFPLPTEFFPLLLTGRWTLAECYWRTCPTASWQLTLIGDPLYRPFAANPALTVEALPEGLAPLPK